MRLISFVFFCPLFLRPRLWPKIAPPHGIAPALSEQILAEADEDDLAILCDFGNG